MEAGYFVSPARTLDSLDFVGFLAITVVLILSSSRDFVSFVSPISALCRISNTIDFVFHRPTNLVTEPKVYGTL